MNNHLEKEAIDIIEDLYKNKGKLLYLVKFGSHLYGTNTNKSDKDFKGIYLPSISNMLLEKHHRTIRFNTSQESIKNSSQDIDIELWSIQYWFELLKKGNIAAIDMLFSHTSKNVILYKSTIIQEIKLFEYSNSLIDIKNSNEYLLYPFQQTKKYGIRGSRIEILSSIICYIKEKIRNNEVAVNDKFAQIIHKIEKTFYNEKYCFIKKDKADQSILYILGNGFPEKIKINEAIQRLEDKFQKDGERSRLAEQNIDIDWKAVSHAMRCLLQFEELITTDNIIFPLNYSNYIKDIKNGKLSWKECESKILDMIEKIEKLLIFYPENKKIEKYQEDIILKCYRLLSQINDKSQEKNFL